MAAQFPTTATGSPALTSGSYSNEPLQTLEDFQDKKIRSHATALSKLIEGLGGEPLVYSA